MGVGRLRLGGISPFLPLSVGEDFVKVLPSHMKMPPDHYKGHMPHQRDMPPLLVLVAAMGKREPVNELQ